MIEKILVANRGTIAVSIIRACRCLGIQSVAVYSKEDTKSLHVQLADQSICIGQGSLENSYVNREHMISAALYMGADAIHPGCGFLAEDAEFAKLCQQHGLIFIGPSPELLEQLHDGSQMEQIVAKVTPALLSGNSTPISLNETAKEVMDFSRTIEVPIVADHFGNIVALGERDCLSQENGQTILEETPSPALDTKSQKNLGQAAVEIAKATHYTNAGTVSFALDKSNRFCFTGITASISSGHALTEMAAGTDLIVEQIRIADEEPLSFKQEDIAAKGHALACRVRAQLSCKDSKAESGLVKHLHLPAGNGVRVDTALYAGYQIPENHSPEIAQIIVQATDRLAAIQKMQAALDEMVVLGVESNLDFQYSIMEDPKFREGKIDKNLIESL
ncbi:biotin carboxylase N-terminal domain-containing protein [Streptococcus ratti]|uniref:biotin carboxylase n=1 Tax=Streptococcus ratti FA-1 = DSM 20564 TaxID=699248 RepID=A0ABP2R0K3_STRRT|nr:biotin carboxylase N-terminal domain-containing protein [Streptococcus ratti]EJN94845.1 acetyl-CoA carboxylase, biotin carboxylase [Streptococcus ratti FA-1 = DSM 20564]EMP71431.1 acetyl-CoA carboxylase, biotin carboxylase [Streptococcus ratti FA-1 = DSM 20564]QEY06719.1 biotin carboxylase [Streptococcus ratti]VEI59125.1 biotin carboxylase [Streptococcus mutans]